MDQITQTKEVAHALVIKGRNLIDAGQNVGDFAEKCEDVVLIAPKNFFETLLYHYMVNGLRESNDLATEIDDKLAELPKMTLTFNSTASAATINTTNSFMVAFGPDAGTIPEVKAMQNFLHRSLNTSKLREAMSSLGLASARGATRDPVGLLVTAEEALKRPPGDEGYATAVLVPLREAIQETIGELLKRRRTTEKTSNWADKVGSIAKQCGTGGNSPGNIARVAQITHEMINQLSGAKNQHMDRDRIATLFDQGVALLRDIISLIDRDKLRPVSN